MDFYAMLMVMAMAKQPILIQKPVHNTQGQQAQIAQVVNIPNAAAIPPQPRPNRGQKFRAAERQSTGY